MQRPAATTHARTHGTTGPRGAGSDVDGTARELGHRFANPGLPAARLPALRHRRAGRQARRARGGRAVRPVDAGHAAVHRRLLRDQARPATTATRCSSRSGCSTKLLGLGLGIALFGIGVGRGPLGQDPDARRGDRRGAQADALHRRGPRGGRRRRSRRARAGAGLGRAEADPQQPARRAGPARAARVILLRDLGPLPGRQRSTGDRVARPASGCVTDPTATRSSAADVPIGGVIHVLPEGVEESRTPRREGQGGHDRDPARAGRDQATSRPRRTGPYDGIVAYSKICTHVGCPVGLYEQQTHHLLCPCHQSTFDVTRALQGHLRPGRAPLPQLPLGVDDEGYLDRPRTTSRSRSVRASGSADERS